MNPLHSEGLLEPSGTEVLAQLLGQIGHVARVGNPARVNPTKHLLGPITGLSARFERVGPLLGEACQRVDDGFVPHSVDLH
jgi:hypothetical protein